MTPIALSAERIAANLTGSNYRRIRSRICGNAPTLSNEVESVKNLVNEFSQFARFPAAQPVPCDLNEVVESAVAVFAGRLDGVELRVQ